VAVAELALMDVVDKVAVVLVDMLVAL